MEAVSRSGMKATQNQKRECETRAPTTRRLLLRALMDGGSDGN